MTLPSCFRARVCTVGLLFAVCGQACASHDMPSNTAEAGVPQSTPTIDMRDGGTSTMADAVTAPPAVDDDDEPPINPFAADSPWPMSHRNSYCQASSPLGAPRSAKDVVIETANGTLGSVMIIFSNPDARGHRVAWSSSVGEVVKFDLTPNGLSLLDKMSRESTGGITVSGAYALMDKDGVFFAPKGARLFAYKDAIKGDLRSKIELRDSFDLPAEALSATDDSIVGMNLTFDGYLAFATAHGTVGVIKRDFSDLHYLKLGAGEDVSNSIAVDELGGIYVVTGAHMSRVQWTGTKLSQEPSEGAWTSTYDIGPKDPVSGRLGVGSGSTPTLMGKAGHDTFVAIADGATLMHIVLFWRDQIPENWQPIAPGKDRRIAAEIPITFGDAERETSVTEQSLLVRGYGALVVNNDYGNLPDLPGPSEIALTNLPMYAPKGVEKFVWDPAQRKLVSVWANAEVSCPNGIPTMSTATGLAYCVGARKSAWTFEALDWNTGASAFSVALGARPEFNSAYGAAEIGPDRMLYSGALRGTYRVSTP